MTPRRFVHVDAHTEGSMALLHRPSGSLFPGDILAPTAPWRAPLQLALPPDAFNAHPERVAAAARKLLLEVRAAAQRGAREGGGSAVSRTVIPGALGQRRACLLCCSAGVHRCRPERVLTRICPGVEIGSGNRRPASPPLVQEEYEFVLPAHGGNWSRVAALEAEAAWEGAREAGPRRDPFAHDASAAGLGLSPPHDLGLSPPHDLGLSPPHDLPKADL